MIINNQVNWNTDLLEEPMKCHIKFLLNSIRVRCNKYFLQDKLLAAGISYIRLCFWGCKHGVREEVTLNYSISENPVIFC